MKKTKLNKFFLTNKTSKAGVGSAIVATLSPTSTTASTLSATIGGNAGYYCFSTDCNKAGLVSASNTFKMNLGIVFFGIVSAFVYGC
jgi:hypothetical protein